MRTTPNPKIIAWAIERVGKQPSDFTSIGKYAQQWVTGEKVPSVKQMQKLAAKTHVPLSYFYDETIPSMSLQIPDFRRTYFGSAQSPSPELYETINLMQVRQNWLSSYLEDRGATKLNFIGACAEDKNAKRAAAMICSILRLKDGWARTYKVEDAVRHLRTAIESAGIYTCTGSFFHHSSRPYDINEFRGFVLVDEYAPIIFVNTQDAKSAQLFTLVHELAHLLFNEDGVDGSVYELPGEESLCDSVAAEVLVPTSLVFSSFDKLPADKAIEAVRSATKASEIVCLRRAYELGCITKNEYFAMYARYKKKLEELGIKNRPKKSDDGPSYYIVKRSMMGKLFSDTVYEGVKSECLLFSDAYRLTDMKASNFEKYYAEEGLYL